MNDTEHVSEFYQTKCVAWYTFNDAIALHQMVQESRWQPTLWITVATSIKPASNGLVTAEGDRAVLLGIMQIFTSTVRVDVISTKSSRVYVHDFLLPL